MSPKPHPWLDEQHSANLGVLAWSRANADADAAPILGPASSPDPYSQCGCHPDVVAQVWDVLGAELPRAARALVFGTPALVLPSVGVVLAMGLGTTYALRLPGEALADPATAALESVHRYSSVDITLDLRGWGASWRFGAYHRLEPRWVERAGAELS